MRPVIFQTEYEITAFNGIDVYRGSIDDAGRDFSVEIPKLDSACEHRIYEPGRRHLLRHYSGMVEGGPQPWLFGDEMLGRLKSAAAAKEKQQESLLPKLSKADTNRLQEHRDDELRKELAQLLRQGSPRHIDEWVNRKANDLEGVRDVLKMILKVLITGSSDS